MNKAFVREDDTRADQELDLEIDGLDGIPRGSKNYMTPQGAQRLRAELNELLNKERPSLVEGINRYSSHRDFSENAEYNKSKKRLHQIDGRIRFLTKRLEHTEVVDPTRQKADSVLFGATVTVTHEDGEERIYRIVGIDETDVQRGLVSWTSPIANALLGRRVGEVSTLKTLKCEEELEIIDIRYEEIS